MGEGVFDGTCHICDEKVTVKKTSDSKWKRFNSDGTEHIHDNVITVTEVLSSKYYPLEKEDKTKKIADMTLEELEKRIRDVVKGEVMMQISTFLAAWKGFGDGPPIKKLIDVDGRKYHVMGKLDKQEGDMIIEAKFVWSGRTEEKNLRYAYEQCDMYGWLTDLTKSKIVIHNIGKNTSEEYLHVNDHKHGQELIVSFIRSKFYA